MNSQERFHETMACGGAAPPRYESEFAPETIPAWREAGFLDGAGPEGVFALDRHDAVDLEWRRHGGDKEVIDTEEALDRLPQAYNPADAERFPEDWAAKTAGWRNRDYAVFAEPWNEGLFQILGIGDGASLSRALVAICERPALAEAAMDCYAGYLESIMDRVADDVQLDYAFLYEPIASNYGLVAGPETYRRFALPALRRVVDRLEARGVQWRIVWSAGAVTELVPIWMEAGVNGIYVNQAGQARVSYRDLRRRFDKALRLFGGIDWRAVVDGPAATEAFLAREVRPLLEDGGFIPYLDDTIRAYMPFDHFRHYRRELDGIVAQVHA